MSAWKETAENPWPAYYEKMRGRPPRETLARALTMFAEEDRAPGDALDLGAGNGRDALELLRRGWRVLAIDSEASGLAEIEQAARGLPGRLTTVARPMQEASLAADDLVNASFCLFMLSADELAHLFARIKAALRPGGRFAGHFLGPRDSWSAREGTTVMTQEEMRSLLRPLAVEWLWEEEEDGVTPRGEAKHWHIFHVVARKPE